MGIRHLIHDEPDPDWVLQPPVIESLGALAEHGMAYDFVGVLLRHLEHVPVLAAAVGDLHIVIDHLNKPPVGTDGYARWVDLIGAAASFPERVRQGVGSAQRRPQRRLGRPPTCRVRSTSP